MSKSSEIILNWVNNEIKLRPKIKDIKTSFSNGYHFAEILYILKLISSEEFSNFLNTDNISDKKSNFAKIEKICQKLFNLIIPEKDINLIINKDYSQAVVLLYKIRNCIYKKNLHFNDIQIFGSAFSNNEIQNQMKDIIKRQFYSEEEDKDEKSKNNSPINDSESNYDENIKSKRNEEEKNILKKNSYKYIINDDIKEEKEEYDEIIKKENSLKNKTISNNMINIKRHLPSIKIKKDEKIINSEHINYFKNKVLIKPKNILAPINHRLLKNKSNSCENIFLSQNKSKQNNIVPLRNTNKLDYYNELFPTKDNCNSQWIDICHFNQKVEELGVTSNDYKIEEENNVLLDNGEFITSTKVFHNQNQKNLEIKNDTLYDTMYNTKTVAEISSELRNKIKYKKLENEIKQKEIKKELSHNNIDDNKTSINFLKINKNKFFEKNKSMSLMFKNYYNKYLLRRLEYSKLLDNIVNKDNY